MKALYIDTETTGLDAKTHGIIQIAGGIEIQGSLRETFDFKCKPFKGKLINKEALEVHGMTLDEIKTFAEPETVYQDLTAIMSKYVDKFDKSDKFYPAGFRVGFDLDFLNQWFVDNGDKYFGSWQNWHGLDPLPFLHAMEARGEIKLKNYKLETVCEHFNIDLKAHDAASDIQATWYLVHSLVLKNQGDIIVPGKPFNYKLGENS